MAMHCQSRAAAFVAGMIAMLAAGCAGPQPSGRAAALQSCDSDTASGPLPAGCGLVCRAVLPVRVQDNLPIVTVWIDDQPANLLLDTGASVSSLTPDGASRLGLPHATSAAGQIWGIGGGQARSLVRVRHLAFGHVSLHDGHLEVLVIGRPVVGAAPDGGLGDDILHHYDIDLDFPHGVVRLYQGRACGASLPGWTAQDASVPWTRAFPAGWQVAIPATLDGHPTQALIDSGAETTVVGVRAALAAGVPEAELTSDLDTKMMGVGPGKFRPSCTASRPWRSAARRCRTWRPRSSRFRSAPSAWCWARITC